MQCASLCVCVCVQTCTYLLCVFYVYTQKLLAKWYETIHSLVPKLALAHPAVSLVLFHTQLVTSS